MDENYWGASNIPDSYFRTKEYGSDIPYLEIVYEEAEIPTLSQWGLTILLLMLLAAAAIVIRKRRRSVV